MPLDKVDNYLLLDSRQKDNPVNGWNLQFLNNLQINLDGLRLSSLPHQPLPLTAIEGGFGGLENPTGVAVDAEGAIYISDCDWHRIFKVIRYPELKSQAYFFRIGKGSFANDRFIYVSTANRVERWPQTLQREPSSLSDVNIVCETVWNEFQARHLILDFIQAEGAEWIETEWQDDYPAHLLAGTCCDLSISPLPCLGGWGSQPRQLNQPRGLAISPSGNLYVADSGNDRIQVLSLNGLFLKALWGEQIGLSEPWDVVVDGNGDVYIADTGNHRLQKYDCQTRQFSIIDGTVLNAHVFQVLYGVEARARFVFVPVRQRLERWPSALEPIPAGNHEIQILSETVGSVEVARQLVLETIDARGAKDILVEWEAAYPTALDSATHFERPTHLAIDQAGHLYVVDQSTDYVRVLNRSGHLLDQVTYAREVRNRFQPTAVGVDAEGKLLLANGTRIECFRFDAKGSHYEGPYTTWKGTCGGIVADVEGHSWAVGNEVGGLAELVSSKCFESAGTFVSKPLDSEIEHCQWHKVVLNFASEIPVGTSITVWTHTADTKQSAEEINALTPGDWQTGQTNGQDILVLSSPGRWLWIKLEFKGNGTETPVLKQLKVFFPRTTYLQYLPAVYQTDPVSKDFLERFLSIFETTASSIEAPIDSISRYFNPDGVPESFLTWLAGWVDMIFEPAWAPETRRSLLRHAPELYRQRGTPGGLKAFLQLALGIKVEILEHFQLRQWLFLASQSQLGSSSELWGNSIVSRLQLEENSRIGDFALVSTGDPLRDPFHVYAHQFSVFLPAAQCRSEQTERQLRRLIDLEKPAYTRYTLCKVEARFRVGVQSTVGLDTLVGHYPRMVLNYCATLGYDSVLSGETKAVQETFKVGLHSRVGVYSVLG
jgi:phage tail-like protein